MKRILILFITVLILSSGFSNHYKSILGEEEMGRLIGRGPMYTMCWSFACQPSFPGQGTCMGWSGPGLDTEHICDYCNGDPMARGKFCKPTEEKIICSVYGRDNICGQLLKGICVSEFDEESGYYISYCEFAGEWETYGMCKWGWEYCTETPVP